MTKEQLITSIFAHIDELDKQTKIVCKDLDYIAYHHFFILSDFAFCSVYCAEFTGYWISFNQLMKDKQFIQYYRKHKKTFKARKMRRCD